MYYQIQEYELSYCYVYETFFSHRGPLGFWKNRADIQIVERKNILSQISKSPILLQRDSASL